MSFLKNLDKEYKKLVDLGAEKIEIGRTMLNRPIYAFAIGCGYPKIIAQYAIHAREFITYYLANLHAVTLLKKIKKGIGTIYIIPVVNIDGVALCIDGINSAPQYAEELLKLNQSNDFSLWKANARGVDLNVNFPALWGTGAKNIRQAGAQNYIGLCPASENETRTLMGFTNKIKPDLTLSFHSKGEVIYYDFHQSLKRKISDKKVAKVVSKSTGYQIVPSGKSAGGYKDWCISHGITALTIEVGRENLAHPIKPISLPQIWQKTRTIYDDLLDFYHKKSG